ncbi:MAG: HD domain-containing protein [Nitrosopumilus sp.]|jgi:(p)ppGpp synthase/HD superfamily hydrolase|nr:MAG: HD domain-containing protein [Nitrosopumilus sp.]
MSKIDSAMEFAKERHKGQTRKNGSTLHFDHLEKVVSRLKNLGVTDENTLCAGWLHDTIEDGKATFDEIEQIFGHSTALLVLSLSKDESLPKKDKENQYVVQLKTASFEAKMVKLCDISANLKDMENSDMSKTKKRKTVAQKLHYLRAIKSELSKHILEFPKIGSYVDGINDFAKEFHQKPVFL